MRAGRAGTGGGTSAAGAAAVGGLTGTEPGGGPPGGGLGVSAGRGPAGGCGVRVVVVWAGDGGADELEVEVASGGGAPVGGVGVSGLGGAVGEVGDGDSTGMGASGSIREATFLVVCLALSLSASSHSSFSFCDAAHTLNDLTLVCSSKPNLRVESGEASTIVRPHVAKSNT